MTAALFALLSVPADLPSVADAVKGLTKKEGLIESYVDLAKGRLLLKLPKPADESGLVAEYLYANSLASGLGANEIGLDPGEDGESFIIRFRVRGEKLVVEAVNTTYRATTDNVDERRSVEKSFPSSVLWAGKLEGRDSDGTSVTDITAFLVRDAHRSAATLSGPGSNYSLDANRSFLMPEGCLSFPDNLEFDASLTFSSSTARRDVSETTPDGQAVTIIQHHSLVRLPDSGFQPREFDPRSGYFGLTTFDFAAKLDQPLIQRFIARHRLEKTDLTKAQSPVKKPIIYYLDRGAPEPVRSALLEGGRWWAQAFESAGFLDAFKVEVLPESAHPLDIRYNVIQWIHRSTRGYSVGGSIIDPRTGEILKGMVRLDSSRIRQDMLIFEGLVGAGGALSGQANDMSIPGLARIRQLSAHEIGHTLGLKHNFAGSVRNRASVMDYPGPKLALRANGDIDFSQAYGVGIGDWDKFAIRYGYGTSTEADRKRLLDDVHVGAQTYLTDEDDPGQGGADWRSSKWDNGNNPIAGLRNTLAIRNTALAKFSDRAIRDFTPRSQLEISLGPVYFFHRYDLATLCKTIGGLEYEHSVKVPKGHAAGSIVRPVSAERQAEALNLILECIAPKFLDLPGDITSQLGPPAPGYFDRREKFKNTTTYAFDSVGAAITGADLAFSELLNPVRCIRLVELHTRDASLPSLEGTLSKITAKVFNFAPDTSRRAEIARGVQSAYLDRLLDLIDADVPRHTRSRAVAELTKVIAIVGGRTTSGSPESVAHYRLLAGEIDKFLARPMGEGKRSAKPLGPMPGSPIGCSQS
ncbi:MAG: zinc-dependent metalloprotease [Chlorobia bacterium]|nr:zinc-dependent metalloprotease [Fimbriimonadaceae bacterium]